MCSRRGHRFELASKNWLGNWSNLCSTILRQPCMSLLHNCNNFQERRDHSRWKAGGGREVQTRVRLKSTIRIGRHLSGKGHLRYCPPGTYCIRCNLPTRCRSCIFQQGNWSSFLQMILRNHCRGIGGDEELMKYTRAGHALVRVVSLSVGSE